MKKLSITLILLLLAVVAQAQIEKGDIQLGGNISFSSSRNDGNNRTFLNIQPRGGLFLSNTTALGLIIGYGHSKDPVFDTQNNSVIERTSSQLQYGVYARFHKPLVENLYLFLQPSVILSSGSSEQEGNDTGDTSSFNLQVQPGLAYFLTSRFALDMTFGILAYTSSKVEDQGIEQTTDSFNFALNPSSVSLGLSYFIK